MYTSIFYSVLSRSIFSTMWSSIFPWHRNIHDSENAL